MEADDTAVILYSGGTTGKPKGILLSNMNFISEGMMVAAWGGLDETDSILAILPIFHGFGLGVCVNAAKVHEEMLPPLVQRPCAGSCG